MISSRSPNEIRLWPMEEGILTEVMSSLSERVGEGGVVRLRYPDPLVHFEEDVAYHQIYEMEGDMNTEEQHPVVD